MSKLQRNLAPQRKLPPQPKSKAELAQKLESIAVQKASYRRLQRLLRLVRLNILAIAITVGVCSYFLFHYVTFLAPIKYPIKHAVDALVPWLIFTMLFLAFSKIELRKMRPRRWHFILVALQFSLPLVLVLLLRFFPDTFGSMSVELEGFMACVITPTAAAASVITGKLGGDESSLTTYTLLSSMGAAIAIPLIFPLISTSVHAGFWSEFLLIMQRVFPMIVLPLILAQLMRWLIKPMHRFVVSKLSGASFYIWAFTLITVSATVCSNIMNSHQDRMTLINLAVVGLIATALQFGLGKFIGHLEGQRISAGQGLGQKNMVFGIWVTYTYLSPAASIAPGCYMLWQNVVNSWQLYYRETRHLTYTDKM